MYENKGDEFEKRVVSKSDDELGFVAIKEENPRKEIREEMP